MTEQPVPYANGAASSAVPATVPTVPKRRLEKHYATINLAPPYETHTCTIWLDHPPALRQQLGNPATIPAAFVQLFRDVDFLDHDGNPYPPPSDPGFLEQAPTPVLVSMVRALLAGVAPPPTIPVTNAEGSTP